MVNNKPARRLACVLAVVLMAGLTGGCTTSAVGDNEDLSGVVDGNVYKNDALGFEVTFPEDYTVLDQQQTEKLMSEVVEQIKESYDSAEEAEAAIQASVPVTIVLKHPLTYSGLNSNLTLIISADPVPAFLSGNIVGIANAAYRDSTRSTYIKDVAEAVLVGGRDAAVIKETHKVNGTKTLQRQYFLVINDYLVTMTLTAANQNEMNELMQAVDSFHYD